MRHWHEDQVRWGREVPWHQFGPAPGRWAPERAPLTPGGRHARWGSDVAREFWNTGAQMVAQEGWARRLARRVAVKKVKKDRRSGVDVVRAVQGAGVHDPSPNPIDHSPEAMEAQAAHFNGGGTIEDAPALGLWNYIQATPERFTVRTTEGDRGISPNHTVIDNVTGEIWFVKGRPHGMFAPEVKEVLAAEIMRQAGFSMPITRLGQAGDLPKKREDRLGEEQGIVMLQRDWTQTAYGSEFGAPRLTNAGREGEGDRLGRKLARGNDPAALARMIVFDYLIDNSVDRHSGNVMLVASPPGALPAEGDQPAGMDLAILDHGLAFGGWFDEPPGFKDFDQFFADYRGKSWRYSDALEASAGGDTGVLEAYIQDAFDEFRKVKPAELRRVLRLAGAPEEMVASFVHAFEERQRHIRRAGAVQSAMAAMRIRGVERPALPVRRPAKKALPQRRIAA